jgi:dTDP-4-dehydrorhamnose 3,5-epimerase-like enzyme
MGIEQCRLIDLPKIQDPRGNLSFAEGTRHIPFEIRRVFYIYEVPTGESRGAHAHKTLEQFFLCLSGSFNVHLDDGRQKKTFQLTRPWQGLYVPPMIWVWGGEFAANSVCMVLASAFYEESDYYRSYPAFVEAIKTR